MLRYSVMPNGIPLEDLKGIAYQYRAHNIRDLTAAGQIVCDLPDDAIPLMKQDNRIIIRPIYKIGVIPPPKIQQITPPISITEAGDQPIYAMSQVQLSMLWYELRNSFTPPQAGEGISIAILDTGIRKTHIGLRDKVTFEQNFTTSPTVSDVFSHGTGVAFMAVGGKHAAGQEAGILPEGSVLSFKVINDDGTGTVESVIDALDVIIRMRRTAVDKGGMMTDPDWINGVNMSLGVEDDGDPNNPLRAAIKAATDLPEPYGISIYAAAGNSGPDPGTITLPASMPEVYACGVVTFEPFTVWKYSSRGPALDGTIKPDLCLFGVNVVTAGAQSDDAFEVKSGTSFSSPCVCAGALGLQRILTDIGILQGPVVHKSVEENLPSLQLFSVKPSDAESQAGKDNSYGIGIPYGGKILQMLKQATGASQIAQVLTPVMGMVMMAGVMKSMVK